jgi:hypothetical protein
MAIQHVLPYIAVLAPISHVGVTVMTVHSRQQTAGGHGVATLKSLWATWHLNAVLWWEIPLEIPEILIGQKIDEIWNLA